MRPLADLNMADFERWRELVELASEPNPFFEPEFVIPAAEALGGGISLLIAGNERGWLGCMPVQTAAGASGWMSLPVRGVVSWKHLYCFLGTPLLCRDREVEAMRALIDLTTVRGFIGLDQINAGGVAAAALRVACGSDYKPVPFTRIDRAGLRRGRDGWDLGISGKRRRELKRQRRRLEEHGGGVVRTIDRAGDPEAVERFLEIEASGWKGERGTALGSDPTHAEFFRRICRGFHGRGRLQLLSLEAGDKVHAMLCSFLAAGTAFQFKIAVDAESAGFGPGIQIEVDAVESMDTKLPGVHAIDSCADPANQMANRLFPSRVELETLAIPGNFSRRPNLAFMRAALKARNAIRRMK